MRVVARAWGPGCVRPFVCTRSGGQFAFGVTFFLVFLGGDGRRIPSKNAAEAVTDAATSRGEVIVASAWWFVEFDGADRVRSIVAAMSAAASGGRAGSPPFIFQSPNGPASASSCPLTPHRSTLLLALQKGF